MGKIRTLWDDYLRRRNRLLIPQPRPQTPLADHDKRLWFRCLADSASVGDAPPYGAIKITGTELDADGQPYLTFKQPDADSLTGCALLGHRGAVSNTFGRCTFEPWWAAYNTANTPAFDESWGTESGQWTLKKGNSGFKVLGGAANGRVLVKPEIIKPLIYGESTGSNTLTYTATGAADQQYLNIGNGNWNGVKVDSVNDRFEILDSGGDGKYLFHVTLNFSRTSGAATEHKFYLGKGLSFGFFGAGYEFAFKTVSNADWHNVSMLAVATCSVGDYLKIFWDQTAAATIDVIALNAYVLKLADG